MSIIHPRTARYTAALPQPWPDLPEPAASVQCSACSWAWRHGAMRLKTINRICRIHGLYLGGGDDG